MVIDFRKIIKKKRCINMVNVNSDLEVSKKKEIEKFVSNLIKDFDFKKTPFVDIVSIVKKDGFVVEPREMDIETTGCLFIDNEDNKRSIWVNTIFKNPDNEDDVILKKSRFITAHEYGHYKFHKFSTAHRDTYHRTDQLELEADYFARSILMPLKYFNSCYIAVRDFSNNDTDYILNILSKFFDVTKNKVSKRIKDLGELGELLA